MIIIFFLRLCNFNFRKHFFEIIKGNWERKRKTTLNEPSKIPPKSGSISKNIKPNRKHKKGEVKSTNSPKSHPELMNINGEDQVNRDHKTIMYKESRRDQKYKIEEDRVNYGVKTKKEGEVNENSRSVNSKESQTGPKDGNRQDKINSPKESHAPMNSHEDYPNIDFRFLTESARNYPNDPNEKLIKKNEETPDNDGQERSWKSVVSNFFSEGFRFLTESARNFWDSFIGIFGSLRRQPDRFEDEDKDLMNNLSPSGESGFWY